MSLSINVFSDLYCAGLTEDGEEYIGHIFFVEAVAPGGARLVHVQGFDGVSVEYDEEFGSIHYGDIRDEGSAKAEALARKVQAHLEAGGKLDPAYWNEVDPVYGSNAYEPLDALGYFKEREKQAG